MNTPADVSPELDALLRALAGTPAPCQQADAELWFAQDPRHAIEACQRCPALVQCRALAAAVRPTAGVLAGVDHERHGRRRREPEQVAS